MAPYSSRLTVLGETRTAMPFCTRLPADGRDEEHGHQILGEHLHG